MNYQLDSLLAGKKSYPRYDDLTLSLLSTNEDVLLSRRQMQFSTPGTIQLTNLSTHVDDVGSGDTDVILACTSLYPGDTSALIL
jgi:hypothetical protein